MGKQTANQKQKFQVCSLLTLHCKTVDEEQWLCEYEEGWSDKRIALECDVSISTVEGFRKANFGNVKPIPPPKNMNIDDIMARVGFLESAVKRLEERNVTIVNRLNRVFELARQGSLKLDGEL